MTKKAKYSYKFADRMFKTPRSFVREILKVTENPEIISFAGGLPSPESFPVKSISHSVNKVLSEDGKDALQYSTTEGYRPLREYIAQRYSKYGLEVDADEILITNGSQQCLDLVGKIFLNKDDVVVLENPTYLAAIQAFSLYEPVFKTVTLLNDGADLDELEKILIEKNPKIFYSVTNFQNPTGITYSDKKRNELASLLNEHETVFIEDNPYGEIRFIGEDIPLVKSYLPEGILFGSFSKIVSPGMRLGWIVANAEVMDKLITVKQASDLHSNYFTQRIVYQYLKDNPVDEHIQKIRDLYQVQRNTMISMLDKYFPPNIQYTQPEGGMFIWVTLPEGISTLELFDMAIKEDVAFVPGQAFHVDGSGENTMRLNFSNSDPESIAEGMKRLGMVIATFLSQNN
ncbi:MAG: PLP-dependent aminotransferase family protein [Methanobacteriaceae archaeon]|nr:PLP-dependent aminotransferase family protein [Methanobacteriaceae archaeon]MDP3034364.1 PLP-dependent aminotransferase family protein [Methanobacteriaceae archaeon]MDP3485395.1 PLP-dependent aminotransferase family protein [Methanobacteriaceae archaeon]MDP3622993.1 PLP-dependent aminotransferase family protein [Methanobacteriaceae archaeon]